MTFQPITEAIPIRQDQFGRYRVGQTNVLLDLVIYAYKQGSTPENIIDYYPTLSLDDVYLALGYYLRHQTTIEVYLQQQKVEAEQHQQEHEQQHVPRLTREILLERLKNRHQTGDD